MIYYKSIQEKFPSYRNHMNEQYSNWDPIKVFKRKQLCLKLIKFVSLARTDNLLPAFLQKEDTYTYWNLYFCQYLNLTIPYYYYYYYYYFVPYIIPSIFIFVSASARSYKIGVVGNNWLVGNIIFSETDLRIFLFFCMKLGQSRRKVTGLDFLNKFLIGYICEKVSKVAQNQTLCFFLEYSSNNFLGFCPEVSTKYDLKFKWNLFSRKICNLEIFDLEIAKILPKFRFLVVFSTLDH